MIGTSIAHYRITEKLGEGGMGEVYRARDERLHRDIALKVLPEAFAQDRDRLVRFQREAQVLASLNHPHIAAIHGLEESNGLHCLVLELVEGETLAQRLRQGPVPLEESLSFSQQIAEALEAAHEKGVIHRDLKPGNVKVTPEGSVKVLDFGLAKAFEGEQGTVDISKSPTLSQAATQAGMLLGTAAYMSPEQAKGRPVDKRADVWAFGCVLYELLTGQQAFAGETVTDIIAAVVKTEPDWKALPAETPHSIQKLLRRCVEKDTRRRLQDIGEARIALEEELAGPAAEAAAPLVRPATQPTWQRTLPWLLGGIMTLAALLALWTPWRAGEVEPTPVRLSAIVSGEEVLYTDEGAAAVLSPDGKRLAFVAGSGQQYQLYIRDLDKLEAVPLSGTERARNPFFSPDGQWVAFFTAGKLKKVSVQGGAPLSLCDVQPDSRGGTWGTDDTIVFTPTITTGLFRVPAAGGTPEPLTETAENERSHRWPFFLPDGKSVLFVAQQQGRSYEDASIEVVSLETGQRKVVHQGGTYPGYLPSGHLTFLRQGTLFAAPFDLERLQVKATPVPLVERVLSSGNTGGGHYTFSRPGTLVYLTGTEAGAQSSIVWVDRKGKVTPLLAEKRSYEDVRISPDGKRLAFEINMPGGLDVVWVYDIERGAMTRLTFAPSGNYNPVWTPDGHRITFDDDNNLFWKRADGAGQSEQLLPSDTAQWATSWSPDGKFLAFDRQGQGTNWDIWVLRVGEKEQPVLFLATPFLERNAQFSPNGRWLAYESNESGQSEVYVRPFPGPGGKWQISTEGGSSPRWSPDGRELFYRSGDRVMAVSISVQGDSFHAGKPRMLFQGAFVEPPGPSEAFDVAPDGGRFVMLQPGAEGPGVHTHVNFVFNWFEEVRRFVPSE